MDPNTLVAPLRRNACLFFRRDLPISAPAKLFFLTRVKGIG